ncbi:hypothetical protein BDB00DRAFT_489598 [Zychaea mexicana]|uniref:uncharacterized protein n=1 Tax=Zychaea mexicana TaxID=64656 RepID=UPI0022FE95A2|nr:uncharacterized protein BDB00DRAFT_489598 [Zychaea mexicana]KAI9491419.1 hypothetical protein BDB00DRAFT_489598 [Zychaea mexicana]
MPLSDKVASKLPSIRQPLDLPSTDGMTLEKVLQNQTASPFSLRDFADYLEQTYCAENLAFYMAVSDYQQSARLYFGSTPETLDAPVIISGQPFRFTESERPMLNHEERIRFETLKAKFEDIIERFILTNAAQEVNIPYELRHYLLQTYHEHQSYHPALLKPACVAVVELLRISAFIPFVTDPNRMIVPTPSKTTLSSKSANSSSNSSSSSSSSNNKNSSALSPRRLRSSPSLAANDTTPPPPVPALPLSPGSPLPSRSLSSGGDNTFTASSSSTLSPTPHHHQYQYQQTWLDFDAMSISSTTSTSTSSTSTILKKLTTSFRFRARSQSPPRQTSWRQINIPDPHVFLANHIQQNNAPPTTSSSVPVMERGLSNSSITSTSTVSSRGSITTPTMNPPTSTKCPQPSSSASSSIDTRANHSSQQQNHNHDHHQQQHLPQQPRQQQQQQQQEEQPPGTFQPFIC